MSLRLALILLALPAAALAADAPPASPKITVVAQPASAAATPAAAPTPKLQPVATAPATDPSECRMSCAQTNYFCRAGDQPDGCSDAWTQCVASCTSPNLTPNFSTAP